jgi:hypothetical protein
MEINEFETWYKKIYETENKTEYLNFVWKLMKTPYTEYHYSLILNKNTNKSFKDILGSRFDEHKDAELFLLNKLKNNEDEQYISDIIFYLGKVASRKGKQKEEVYEYLKKYIYSIDDKVREKSIIVLGWLGSIKDFEILGKILLEDKNNKCRAWSATAFMQIGYGQKDTAFMEQSLPYLYEALKQEKDYFVIACIVETVQELTKKKFGLSQKDSEPIENIEKINMAKEKVEKYFKKLYKE